VQRIVPKVRLDMTGNIIFSKLFIALLLALSSCASTTSGGNEEILPKFKFEDPDQYAVDSKNYPTFRVENSIITPPQVMVKGNVINGPKEEIRTNDIWNVTHVHNDYYYIFSEEYQTRQEQLIKKTYSWNVPVNYYFYHLLIDKTGKVVGGWVGFKNRKLVLLPSERRIVFDPSYWRNPEWDKQPSFKATK
jgi:hypothetical protein